MLRRVTITTRIFSPVLSRPRRSFATKIHRLPSVDPDDADFRPPWVYTMSRLVSYTVIPSICLYSVFFYDFGDREHVFQPVRRWAEKQKAVLFSLSPSEEALLKGTKNQRNESTKES